MTLSEIVDLVCLKMHRVDEESNQEARKYVISRYRIIHDSRLWKDTRDIFDFRGQVLLTQDGSPIMDGAGNILATGIAGQIIILPALVGKVIACRWGNFSTLEVEELQTLFRTNPQAFNEIGDPVSFSVVAPSAVHTAPGGQILTVNSTQANANYTVSIRGRYFDQDQSERLTVSGFSLISSQYRYDEIFALSKTSQEYDLIVKDALGGRLLTLPSEETYRFHQRIHFHSTPTSPGTMLLFYKRRCRDLFYDSDATEIQGIDNMVLAAAISDMREGERQYSKAMQKAGEVAGLMQVAIDLESQNAAFPRIIPDDYSSDHLDYGECK